MSLPLFFCPIHDANIGNLSEIMLFSLIKAKRLDKKACFARKKMFVPDFFQKRFLNTHQRNHLRQLSALFELRSPHIDAENQMAKEAVSVLMGLQFLGHFGLQMTKRLLRLTPFFSYSHPTLGTDDIFDLGLSKAFDERLVPRAYWEDMLQYDFNLDLPETVKTVCRRDLEALGLKTERYVCLHIRTSHYHSDAEGDLYRNATPAAYNEAIDYLISQGLTVIRLGDPVAGMFAPRKGYIDYPLSPQKSEMMDLYLMKQCHYYIGMNSGIIDTAFLLNKPVLGVNVSDFLFSKPYKTTDRYIYKRIFSHKLDRELSFKEVLECDTTIHSNVNEGFWRRFLEHYSYVNNNAEDILDAVIEMNEICDPQHPRSSEPSALQAQANSGLRRAERGWIAHEDFDVMADNQYRACIKTCCAGSIGQRYLEKYYA